MQHGGTVAQWLALLPHSKSHGIESRTFLRVLPLLEVFPWVLLFPPTIKVGYGYVC